MVNVNGQDLLSVNDIDRDGEVLKRRAVAERFLTTRVGLEAIWDEEMDCRMTRLGIETSLRGDVQGRETGRVIRCTNDKDCFLVSTEQKMGCFYRNNDDGCVGLVTLLATQLKKTH
jgi:hypothetical protein